MLHINKSNLMATGCKNSKDVVKRRYQVTFCYVTLQFVASSKPAIAINTTGICVWQLPFLMSALLLLLNRQMANKDIDVCPLYMNHAVFCNILTSV